MGLKLKLKSKPEFRWVEIPSDVSIGLQVLETIVLELQMTGFELRQIRRIELAFTEALINAIRHGNGDDPDKLVLIEYGFDGPDFYLAIEDEGAGFNPRDVEDPTGPEQILRPGGRGLLLMQSLVQRVEFNSKGNRIALRLTREVLRAA